MGRDSPNSVEEWEQMYRAVVEDYEDDLAAIEEERAQIQSDAVALGQIISAHEDASVQWKAKERKQDLLIHTLHEAIYDRDQRILAAEDALTREGFVRLNNGKWTRRG